MRYEVQLSYDMHTTVNADNLMSAEAMVIEKYLVNEPDQAYAIVYRNKQPRVKIVKDSKENNWINIGYKFLPY